MKGIHYLAAAFSLLVERGRRVNLTILGGAMPAETIRSSFSEAARGSVTILDRLPEEDVIAAYRSHDVLVFPSSYEGFGMVLLEAMSQRLPVVATPVGCATMLVRHDETGLITPLRNAEALAIALARLLDDRALRTRLADAAFTRVRDISWARTASLTLAVYERALNRKHAFAHA